MIRLNWDNAVNPDRNELVFENKNKSFGAYVIRQEYAKYALLAFGISTFLIMAVTIIPLIRGLMKDDEATKIAVKETEITLMAPPPIDESEPPPPPPPPPPPVQQTIKFTPPVIVKDEEVPEDEPPPTVEELEENNAGVVTQEGDPNAIELPDEEIPEGTGTNEIFTIVEEMPSFPGGEAQLVKYLSQNIKYPARARENGIEGRVYLTFVVGKDGKVGDIKVLRGIGGGCDEEAVRVVKSMPPWRPGKQRGEAVTVQFNLPIQFSLK